MDNAHSIVVLLRNSTFQDSGWTASTTVSESYLPGKRSNCILYRCNSRKLLSSLFHSKNLPLSALFFFQYFFETNNGAPHLFSLMSPIMLPQSSPRPTRLTTVLYLDTSYHVMKLNVSSEHPVTNTDPHQPPPQHHPQSPLTPPNQTVRIPIPVTPCLLPIRYQICP